MSGSSGGGRDRDGDGSSGCEIIERVPLNSPQPAVVATLQQHEQLDVVAVPAGNGRTLAARKQGAPAAIAGTLTPSSMTRLLRCIDQGNRYVAVVLSVSNALVEVEIRPQ